MYFRTLLFAYEKMKVLGYVRSRREFSDRWLGRGKTYVTDFFIKDRTEVIVPEETLEYFMRRLEITMKYLPKKQLAEIESIKKEVEQSVSVARLLGR